MDKISVIVPVYKVEKYLNKCVESIVNQTYKNIEILLIDDGSPDRCPEICDEWARKDDRIVVFHKENGGLSDARNFGLNKASGKYVSFVDSDDIISTFMYEEMIKKISYNDSDICICQFSRFLEGTNPTFTNEAKIQDYNVDEALMELLKENITNHVCNKIFKTSLFKNIKFELDKYYEDILVMYRLILNSQKIVITNSKLYGYMYRKNSITGKSTIKSVNDFIDNINIMCNDLKNIIGDKYINNFRLRCIYLYHLKAVQTKDYAYYNCKKIIKEYEYLKKYKKVIFLMKYTKKDNLKTKFLKIILLLNRKLFWILKNR